MIVFSFLAVQCSAMQFSAVQCSVVQCSAVQTARHINTQTDIATYSINCQRGQLRKKVEQSLLRQFIDR